MKYPEQPSDPFELELGGLLGEEEDLYDAEDNEDRMLILAWSPSSADPIN